MPRDIFVLWNFSKRHDQGLITMYANNAIEAFHKRMSLELSPHPQTQRFLRWVESYGKEKHRLREVIAPRDTTIDAEKWRDQLSIRECWREILQSFSTKPEFCTLHFELTCPECQSVNLLAGRLESYLLCQNEHCTWSRTELQYEDVLDQAKESLMQSCLDLPIDGGTKTDTLLEKLEFWFETLVPEAATDGLRKYLKEMMKLVRSLRRWASQRISGQSNQPNIRIEPEKSKRTFRVERILAAHAEREKDPQWDDLKSQGGGKAHLPELESH